MPRLIKRPVIWSLSHLFPCFFHLHTQIRGLSIGSSLWTPSIRSVTRSTGGVKSSSKSRPLESPSSVSKSHFSESSPLSIFPYGVLLRSYLIAAVCSSSILLSSILHLLSRLSSSESVLLNPDRNLLLRYVLKKTFYVHFCAGESSNEVTQVVSGLKRMGFSGAILTYAKEISPNRNGPQQLTMGYAANNDVRSEIEIWKRGCLKTVRLAGEGDLVALK